MKRIFAAIKINPEPELISFLNTIKNRLGLEKIKWIPIENIHVTLKFFGNTGDDKIYEISELFKCIAKRTFTFKLCFENSGYYGSRNNPKVLWLGVKKNENIISLVNTINHDLQTLGYIADNKNLNSHLTIGRVKKISDQINFSNTLDCDPELIHIYDIDHFALFESTLTKTGAVYSEIENYYFGR